MNVRFDFNRIVDTDSYKSSMPWQYPDGTTQVNSYSESRGCQRGYEKSVFFGLQYYLKRYLSTPYTIEEVEEANEIITAHGEPFPYEGWKRIINVHGGYLPLHIRAVPEGTVVPLHNVLMNVYNTDPELFWLTTWMETQLVRLWYPMTVATQSHYIKKDIYKYLEKTSDDPATEIMFKLHDFGSRGVTCQEQAALGGAAHLTAFMGTDTMAALMLLRKYYHEKIAGYSIPAMEHSTVTSWGKEHEVDAFRNMIRTYGKNGKFPVAMFAGVSDSWDIFNACEKLWGEDLRQEVINSGAVVVIRPDSGHPPTVVGMCAEILADKFGYTLNSKGYKVLNNVRIIQGDGVDYQTIPQIYDEIINHGFSTTNVGFGSGGALLQKLDRDTLEMAFKCNAITRDGQTVEVYKQPVTSTMKRSKKGVLDLIKENGAYKTINLSKIGEEAPNSALVTYYKNGEIFVNDTLSNIRERILHE